MSTPTTVGHVHLRVRDLDRAVDFYRDLLDMAVTERQGRYAFLSFGERHHDLALQGIGEDAPGPSPGVGLYHVAFEVPDPATLRTVADRLATNEVRFHPVDHGISRALYFDDPSGNGVEVYHDEREARDLESWDGRTRPFDPAGLPDPDDAG